MMGNKLCGVVSRKRGTDGGGYIYTSMGSDGVLLSIHGE